MHSNVVCVISDLEKESLVSTVVVHYNELHELPPIPNPYLPPDWNDSMLADMPFEQVLKTFDGLLQWQVWLAFHKGPYCEMDKDDLMQVARLATLYAYQRYDVTKYPTTKFSTYLVRCLWTWLDEENKKAYRRVKVVICQEQEVMQTYLDPSCPDECLLDDVRILLCDDAAAVFDCMVSPPARLLDALSREFSPKVTREMVSRCLGMSRERVSEHITEIKQSIDHVLSGRVYCNR